MIDPTPAQSQEQYLSIEEAEQLLLDRIRQSEGLPEQTVIELVILYSHTGRQKAASEWARRLLAATGDQGKQAAHLLRLGQLSEQIDDYETALAFYSQTLELEPRGIGLCYFAHNNLGYCLNRLGRYEEAEPYCRTAIEIVSERHNAYKNLGISLEGQGQYGLAAESYIESVRQLPSDRLAFDHLEKLWQRHPELSRYLPEIESRLAECRAAVMAACRVH